MKNLPKTCLTSTQCLGTTTTFVWNSIRKFSSERNSKEIFPFRRRQNCVIYKAICSEQSSHQFSRADKYENFLLQKYEFLGDKLCQAGLLLTPAQGNSVHTSLLIFWQTEFQQWRHLKRLNLKQWRKVSEIRSPPVLELNKRRGQLSNRLRMQLAQWQLDIGFQNKWTSFTFILLIQMFSFHILATFYKKLFYNSVWSCFI